MVDGAARRAGWLAWLVLVLSIGAIGGLLGSSLTTDAEPLSPVRRSRGAAERGAPTGRAVRR
jgi:hypothetical protein